MCVYKHTHLHTTFICFVIKLLSVCWILQRKLFWGGRHISTKIAEIHNVSKDQVSSDESLRSSAGQGGW